MLSACAAPTKAAVNTVAVKSFFISTPKFC
jgi:hypothetical protein